MSKILFEKEHIYLDKEFNNKEELIKFAGQKLVEAGYVTDEYIESMLRRENLLTTYISDEIALPHGERDSQEFIRKSGVILIKLKKGVDFGNNHIAKLIFASSGIGNDHLKILSNIAKAAHNKELIHDLKNKDLSTDEIYDKILNSIK